MKKLLLLSLIVTIFGCEGKRGVMGPTGPQGETGPGSRIVYESTTPIPDSLYTVNIPEITLDDMPLVSVYVRMKTFTVWMELPYYFENYPDWGLSCFFTEGEITFIRCKEHYYKIVIVI